MRPYDAMRWNNRHMTDLLIQQTLLQWHLMDFYINNKFQQRKYKAERAVKKDGKTSEES